MMKARRVVLFPPAGAGHLLSMIELARKILLHTHNLSITILIIRPPSSSPFASSSISYHLDAVAASELGFNFRELPQAAFPEVESEGLASNLGFIDNHKPAVSEALTALQETTTITAFIVDLFCITSTTASPHLGIPTFLFLTSGATTTCIVIYLLEMDRKYECDLKYLTKEVEIPGSVRPLPPSTLLDAILRKEEDSYRWYVGNARLCSVLDGILVNTFKKLQPTAIEVLTMDGAAKSEKSANPCKTLTFIDNIVNGQ
ncbi:hypothetical protein EJ110_NYTH09412 [Nymphaea thermarum]|nr:hypothetical protein EJ110_NYTH09412 [Nymphaea thermarum]